MVNKRKRFSTTTSLQFISAENMCHNVVCNQLYILYLIILNKIEQNLSKDLRRTGDAMCDKALLRFSIKMQWEDNILDRPKFRQINSQWTIYTKRSLSQIAHLSSRTQHITNLYKTIIILSQSLDEKG